ncbi:hypothetical protein CIL05_06790 [Virgibacillus profundi]|uniref:DUF3168 domain-containing protein n=1 Tax=Virgibacillus profundi TaxID=2024555 RepID=A0A2A2IFN0_9BACI|nr:hypothetical protein [Virgibacillus profundi]PAV30168.1 hypothetical protein CIL05_06790 [Virgibacillus profundi]PXY54340.1 hypothetical protein CIT14_06875 [Virgibacillus profundi]
MSILANMMNDAYNILHADEQLLRLLYYPPTSIPNNQPNPLDESLPNLVVEQDITKTPTPESLKMWEIINRHIERTSKSDDLENNYLCRIYLYAGKSRPHATNKSTTRQEIVVDIFCHNSFSVDQRMERIGDRAHQLLMNNQVTGLGTIDYANGYDFTAPKEYIAYRHIYQVVRSKR